MVNSMTSKLDTLTCAGCGEKIEECPAGTHGIACKNCGTINHPFNTGEYFYTGDLYDDDSNDLTDDSVV